MDKHIWRQVRTLSSSSIRPTSRWGHSSCVVGEQILFFGGYADSTYMNDLWSFNTITMKWQQIQTHGDIPIQRSNCTMNYDKQTNQIVIFGGGGANKQRFNSINVLDWNSKNWIQLTPKQNQQSPWQRTYHAAQLLKNYLIVFGGQGVADMEDIWIFNFNTLSWKQIKIPNDKPKPCARRFHSSVMIGNQFMVIAGCYGKYRCLSDIYSMDFTTLLETGSTQYLQWEQKKMKNSSFLTRWGHSSVVYDNKIYIFGGRFSNDLNDLLVADFENNTIRTIKTNQQAPPARRRHCAGFIGSSMLVFGGFNGQYFQDLHYISVHQPKSKIQMIMLQDQKMLLECVNNQKYADQAIMSSQNQPFYINIGLMSKMFQNQQKLDQFLSNITGKYKTQQLKTIFTTLYSGYGELNLQINEKQCILESIPETKADKILQQRQRIQKTQTQSGKQIQKTIKRAMNSQNILIKLCEQQFIQYYIQNKSKGYIDQCIKIGQNYYQMSRISLILKSQYFNNLFMRCRESTRFTNLYNQSQIQLVDLIGQDNKIVYEIFFNYIQSGFLVVPDNASVQTYMNLATIADYFLVNSITQMCCNQLIALISTENVQKTLKFAIKMKMSVLMKSCCDYWIKKAFQNVNKLNELDLQVQINKTFIGSQIQVTQNMMKMYSKLRFDLYQVFMEDDKKTLKGKNKQNSNTNVEKENSQNNILQHTTY